MSSPKSAGGCSVIKRIEKLLCRRPPRPAPPLTRALSPEARPLEDGMTVAVVGGGLAGPIFARRLLALTHEAGLNIKVVIFDQTSCNYCAGLMTSLARKTLEELCDLKVPQEVILTELDGCIFVNGAGSSVVEVDTPLVSMLRTDRFGEAGFDDALKYRLLSGIEESLDRLEIIEPVTVNAVQVPQGKAPGWVLYRQRGERQRLRADVLVMACGMRSLERPMMNDFIAQTGYVPPQTMGASVTEVDATHARRNELGHKAIVVDNVLEDCMAAIIPKRPNWVTVSSLHRRLSREDLEQLFSHPQIKRWIDLPDPVAALRCNVICPALVYTAPARNICGEGWLTLGDLTGLGRVLKDGYFACMLGGTLAAEALYYRGSSAQVLAQHYQTPLARAFPPWDSRVGMGLFNLNERLSLTRWFAPLFMEAAQAEEKKGSYGGWVHMGLRSLFTGEICYRVATAIFLGGLVKYYALRPHRLFRHLRGCNRSSE